MAEAEADDASGATKRQVFVRCNGRALRTTVEAVAAFFETVGKPVSILNKCVALAHADCGVSACGARPWPCCARQQGSRRAADFLLETVPLHLRWGEEPSDGTIYETALVTFKKNKACEKAVALSGGTLGDRQVGSRAGLARARGSP